MGKDTGSIRANAKRLGLTLSKLPNGGIASGGRERYSIRGDGGRVNMRARTLSEASRLLSDVRKNRRATSSVGPTAVDSRGKASQYAAYSHSRGKGGTIWTPRGYFATRREAQRFADRNFR